LVTNFLQAVYEIVELIPTGRVTTYGAIAHCLGSKQGARMVGWALSQLHYPTPYPAHRVVNRHGILTGKKHFQTGPSMEALLLAEGILIKNDQIENFEALFWDPNQEIIPALLAL
jgi:methylated-DNA-protein-cysteine methyltransferase-like protein